MLLIPFILLCFALRDASSLLTPPGNVFTAPVSTPPPSSKDDTIPDSAATVWKAVASATPSERNSEILDAEPPPGLAGTYYVNGLASCTFKNGRMVHPFESHGFLKAITIDPDHGTVSLTAKYVNTNVRKWEEIAGRPLFRGAMSAVADMRSDKLTDRLANALSPTTRETANLAVRKWADELISTADNCSFYSMDCDTLDTLGVQNFGDALKGYKMLAHTRVDKERNRLIACALKYQPFDQATDLAFFEFDEHKNLVSKVEHTLPAFIVHDYAITPNYYVVPAASAVFDVSKLPDLLGGRMPATELFAVDNSATGTLLLVPRDGGAPIRVERADGAPSTCFHMGPTYEEDGGAVVANVFTFGEYEFGGEMGFDIHGQSFDPTPWSDSNGGPKLERWTADVGSGSAAVERLHEVVSDMPTFHPDRDGLECRYVYTVCGIRERGWFPFNSIAKHDCRTGELEVWPPEAGEMARNGNGSGWDGGTAVRAEPLFVPKVGATEEDDGYVLSSVHDTKTERTMLEVFDAKSFGNGPIQTIDLGELWGWNVHSSFEPLN